MEVTKFQKGGLLWNNPSVLCEHVLFSMVNKELIGSSQAGSIGGTVRHRGLWEEGQSQGDTWQPPRTEYM